ncbi:23S rRNA (uracil-5-)-methyltransferase RumA [Candidatus Uhrbacteria bacterium RIFOXYC2_FULL_47_19]|uniref:23S rRNA (Uracil-5-)-methyltransferase RumA n=1 Tax=Candidatus Uhrbacteria bacterium RIFOXYC2_FULL_47_19 TaxID=1802424 RepID=A0A1F7WG27_9BACT|nr:MAG: 23S rRNA (uracil-5-)-methyltransferase RumA [Candidatus Uhrbacteria bacterium RIFOXYC2_FULL_47_19]HCC21824.1 23S rRNA (uracil(1939)-C(5))-methyltransferase RlmD [Candidatus Uhrbacteria bacterium]
MKYGELHEIEITSCDRKGRGYGLMNDRPAGVPFTVPGELVEASFVGRCKGVKKFHLEKILKASPKRITPTCPHAGICGGCAWQHINYKFQLELKRQLVNEALERGGLPKRIETVLPSPQTLGYRNRMDFCVGPEGQVGLKEPGRWNSYVDLNVCPLLSPVAADILREFRDWIQTNSVTPWCVFRHTGYVRYLVVREGKNTNRRMITVVTADAPLPGRDDLIARLSPLATSIYHGINPTITDLSLAERLELLSGEELLLERVGGHDYLIPPNSFFQTDTIMAEKLLETVREHVVNSGAKTLLDLYCGVGFFAVGVADLVQQVHGVELDAEAITTARRNAELNGLSNLTFTDAKAESLVWNNERPDLVIVDPPRSGLHPKVIENLLKQRPSTIIYVSCNYDSFVREWSLLETQYHLADLRALDLFPNSPHVELVAKLELK